MEEKLKYIAQSGISESLVEYIEYMKSQVADVRNKINVKPEIANEVRLATIEQLEEFASKLKKLNGTYEAPSDSWE